MRIFTSFCLHLDNIYNTNNIINTICENVLFLYFIRNISNTINIINIENTGFFRTCGSGKKYKQCCGKLHKIRERLNFIKLIIGSSFITCPQNSENI